VFDIEDVCEDVDFGKSFLVKQNRVYTNLIAHEECVRRKQTDLLVDEPDDFIEATAKPPS
jgi:hypothetical protein